MVTFVFQLGDALVEGVQFFFQLSNFALNRKFSSGKITSGGWLLLSGEPGTGSLPLRRHDRPESRTLRFSIVARVVNCGGDSYVYYTGTYDCSDGKWKGEMTSQEHTPTTRPIAERVQNIEFSGIYNDGDAEANVALVGGSIETLDESFDPSSLFALR